MKVFLFAVLFALPVFAGETTVGVKGMVCSMCAQGIEKKFAEAGAENVTVNFDEKEVVITGKDLTDEEIKKIVEWAGYEVAGIRRK